MIAALEGLEADLDADSACPGSGRLAALWAVIGASAVLAVLPVLLAAGVASGGGRVAVAWLAGLVAVVGGVKLAAAAWGLAASAD